VQLRALAQGQGVEIGEPEIIAKTGWTTGDLMAAIRAEGPPEVFDFVSLLIGVNNLYRGLSADDFKSEFRILLHDALRFARMTPQHVVVLSIPDWGATPFAEGKDRVAISAVTDSFNEICRTEALASGVHYVDVTEISRSGLSDPSLLTTDHLHPSGKMYSLWAGTVFNTVFG
jgi:lysophospholipase L1-like esterase